MDLNEALRVISLYNYRPPGASRTGEYHCATGTVDGYNPGSGLQSCSHHSADTNTNWRIDMNEVLRVISFYNYRPAGGSRTGEYYASSGGSADGIR